MEKTKRKTLADFKDFDFICLNNQIAIYIPPVAKVSQGGIIIPDSAMMDALKNYFDRNPYHLVVSSSSHAEASGIDSGDFVKIDLAIVQPDMFFTTPAFKDDNFLLLESFCVKGKLLGSSVEHLDSLDALKFIERMKEAPKSTLLKPV